MYSAVLIIPAELKAQADAVGKAMGWGPVSYTIPLPDAENLTHYGLRADVDIQFIRWIRGQDPLPKELDNPAIGPVLEALIADFSPDPDDEESSTLWGREHLEAVVAKHWNQEEEPDEEE